MTLLTLRTGRARRRGFSVLELLIATTIAMVILLVVTKWFRDLSQQTSRSRALIEMSGQMRAVIAQLENDMRGATFPRGAMPASSGSLGYIQYFEGIATDAAPNGDLLNHLTLPTTGAVTNITTVRYPVPGTPPTQGTANLVAATTHYQNINGTINTAVDPTTSRFGDMDDVISLTTRNTDAPFEGKMVFRQNAIATSPPVIGLPQTITSPMAEVLWWVEGFDENQDGVIADAERRLHRRAFLIRPDLSNAVNVLWHSLINNGLVGGIAGANMDTPDALRVMLEQCDISFHIDSNGNAVANSLAELSKPSNLPTAPVAAWCKRITMGQLFRQDPPVLAPPPFAGQITIAGKSTIPGFRLLDVFVFPKTSPTTPLGQIGANRFGEDVMLSSVAAFDARVFDPLAQIKLHSPGTQVQPGDPGYEWKQPGDAGVVAQAQVGQGAFVDLNYAHAEMPSSVMPNSNSWFSGPPNQFSGFFRVNGGNATHLLTSYDTWSPLSNVIMDGVDNDTTTAGIIGVIDDPTELAQETSQATTPPYNFPLRALQVTIRAYDPDSKQIRQLKASASYTND